MTWASTDRSLDLEKHEIRRAGKLLDLTPREYDGVACLMRHANSVVTHRLLLSEVWGPQCEGDREYLRVCINRLRRTTEDDPAHPHIIVTESSVGYRLHPSGTR